MGTAKRVSPFLPEKYLGLHSMAEVFDWELKNLPFLKSSSGRSLYYALLMQCCINPVRTKFPFKTLHTYLTDKALRVRIHEFEKLGLLTFDSDIRDGRARTVTPTDKLMALFGLHSAALREKFSQRFLFFPKD